MLGDHKRLNSVAVLLLRSGYWKHGFEERSYWASFDALLILLTFGDAHLVRFVGNLDTIFWTGLTSTA
jgi:hypothetical protein